MPHKLPSTPSDDFTSSKPHRPALFSEFPGVKPIKEKRPEINPTSTSNTTFTTSTSNTTSTSITTSTCLTPDDLSAGVDYLGLASVEGSIANTLPPKISQVSKLLNAISTWVSVPPQGELSSHDVGYNSPKTEGADTHAPSGDGEESSNVILPPVDSVNVSKVQWSLFNGQFVDIFPLSVLLWRCHFMKFCHKLIKQLHNLGQLFLAVHACS